MSAAGQRHFVGKSAQHEVAAWLRDSCRQVLLVGSEAALRRLPGALVRAALEEAGADYVPFGDFQPNPLYASAEAGARAYREGGCEALIAVGGGSALDVAKAIRGLTGKVAAPLLAVPTTAGTGSEATHFAVLYEGGRKLSLTDACYLPDAVWFLPEALATLPARQRQATLLDAFCHTVESSWSVRATAASQALATEALALLERFADSYAEGGDDAAAAEALCRAAYLAGRAIDATQTTAGHAMCYRLTALAGIPHGHAAALCVDALWPYMRSHAADCRDARGEAYLRAVFERLAPHLDWLAVRLTRWDLRCLALACTEAHVAQLADTVNPVRLQNHPIALGKEAIAMLYRQILSGGTPCK